MQEGKPSEALLYIAKVTRRWWGSNKVLVFSLRSYCTVGGRAVSGALAWCTCMCGGIASVNKNCEQVLYMYRVVFQHGSCAYATLVSLHSAFASTPRREADWSTKR